MRFKSFLDMDYLGQGPRCERVFVEVTASSTTIEHCLLVHNGQVIDESDLHADDLRQVTEFKRDCMQQVSDFEDEYKSYLDDQRKSNRSWEVG